MSFLFHNEVKDYLFTQRNQTKHLPMKIAKPVFFSLCRHCVLSAESSAFGLVDIACRLTWPFEAKDILRYVSSSF